MAEKDIVSELQKKLLEHAQQIGKILTTLHMLREYDDSIVIPDINSLMDSTTTKEGTLHSRKTIRPDEFYQMSNTEATEKYLRKIGHAVSLEEIFESLKRGGVKFSSNGRNILNMQLTRATKKFAKMTHGDSVNFGLLEWYPKKRKNVVQEESGEVESDMAGEETNEVNVAEEVTESQK